MDTTIPPTAPPPAPHYRLNPYVALGNETFLDPRISFVGKGILAVAMGAALTRTDEEQTFSADTLPKGGESRQTIAAELESLASLGYVLPMKVGQ